MGKIKETKHLRIRPLFGPFWKIWTKLCCRFVLLLIFLFGPFWVLQPMNRPVGNTVVGYLIGFEGIWVSKKWSSSPQNHRWRDITVHEVQCCFVYLQINFKMLRFLRLMEMRSKWLEFLLCAQLCRSLKKSSFLAWKSD